MILDAIINIIYTWGLGLLPAFIIRKLIRRPLKKLYAVPIAFVIYFIHLILTVAIHQALGINDRPGSALTLVGLVSFYIMVSGEKAKTNTAK